jgi:hypothetical protein
MPSPASPAPINVTVYANCQGAAILEILRRAVCVPMTTRFYVNFRWINANLPVPERELRETEVFIYQPLDNHGHCNSDYWISHLPERCIKVSFPYLYFLGYHPDYTVDPLNIKTIGEGRPFGLFPYASSRLMELIRESQLSAEDILQASRGEEFLSSNFIAEQTLESLRILRQKERTTTIKIADFIEQHFCSVRLFHTVNHPANVIFEVLLSQMLKHLPMPSSLTPASATAGRELLDSTTVPIFPCVAKHFSMSFEDRPVANAERLSYEEYYRLYFSTLYPHYLRAS